MAVVAGCSDGLLIKHLWMQMTGEGCQMRVRSDSSAARAMVQRQGIGRVRHLDASLLWVQQKEKDKVLTAGAKLRRHRRQELDPQETLWAALHAEGGECSTR